MSFTFFIKNVVIYKLIEKKATSFFCEKSTVKLIELFQESADDVALRSILIVFLTYELKVEGGLL